MGHAMGINQLKPQGLPLRGEDVSQQQAAVPAESLKVTRGEKDYVEAERGGAVGGVSLGI